MVDEAQNTDLFKQLLTDRINVDPMTALVVVSDTSDLDITIYSIDMEDELLLLLPCC